MSGVPFAEIRTWMFDEALPTWSKHGVDDVSGGFREELTLDGADAGSAFVRTRVICRQAYVFAHAYSLGWPEGLALSERACEYLERKAWLDDGGWARLLKPDGAVLDQTSDLYDLGFVLLAFAWRNRAAPDARSRQRAHEVLDFIQQRLAAPNGGYWPDINGSGELLQNPHMHLTEACIAAYNSFADERFLTEAKALVSLMRQRFFDGRTLGERFDVDWQRQYGQAGPALEPGHHFEWTWILAQHARLTGEDVAGDARAVAAFAEANGVDRRSGAVYDAIDENGTVIASTSRCWPNTERIKAHLALFELIGADSSAPVAQSARLLLDRYLSTPMRGFWHDQFDAEGRRLSDAVRASTFYHLFMAFAEVLRLESRLSAANHTP